VTGKRRTRLRRLLHHLRTEHATPGRLAAAVALGLFVGTLPLYGLHLPICIGLALLFGLNKATTYLAANVSNPLFLPLLVFACVQAGTLTRTGAFLPLGVDDLQRVGARTFLSAWVTGSVEVGLVLAAIGAAATLRIARGRPGLEDTWEPRVRAIADRYRPAGRFVAGFVAGKLRGDPLYRWAASNALPAAAVLDLGCGHGALCVLLASPGNDVHGIDRDRRRIAAARIASRALPVRFTVDDVRRSDLPPADIVVLADVLHYLPAADQDALLARAAAAVRPGGRIWVREMIRGRGLRTAFGIFSERFLHAFEPLCFRTQHDIVRALQSAGLSCEVLPMSEGTPFANVLVEGRRPASPDYS